MRRPLSCNRGFTLVELLVVITIIGVLASLVFGSWSRIREYNRRTVCTSNLRQIGAGCIRYSIDWGDFFPSVFDPGGTSNPLKSLSLLYDSYIPLRKIFLCPSTADMCTDLQPGDSFAPHGIAGRNDPKPRQTSYGYDDTKGPLTDPEVPIAADAPPSAEEQVGGVSATPGAGSETAVMNSANHKRGPTDRGGQNVLFCNGNVKWFVDPTAGINHDNIYDATDKKNPGDTDSYIHQTSTQ